MSLTSTTGAQIDINLDAVAYLYPSKEFTTAYFTVGDHGKLFSIGRQGIARRHPRCVITLGAADPQRNLNAATR
jgi:hypothetical protein